MKKLSDLVEDIRIDLQILQTSHDIKELDKVSDRLAINAAELRRRVYKKDSEYSWVVKLERFGF